MSARELSFITSNPPGVLDLSIEAYWNEARSVLLVETRVREIEGLRDLVSLSRYPHALERTGGAPRETVTRRVLTLADCWVRELRSLLEREVPHVRCLGSKSSGMDEEQCTGSDRARRFGDAAWQLPEGWGFSMGRNAVLRPFCPCCLKRSGRALAGGAADIDATPLPLAGDAS